MPYRALAILTVSLTFCGLISAQNAPWTKIQTKHFKVIGNADADRLRSVSLRLEQFRSAVHQELGLPSATSVETRVVIFRDAASFRSFKPKRTDGTPDDLVSGLFQSGNDVNYISAADDGGEISTIFHEYVHDVLARNYAGNEIPSWLNEGLAEYFQGFRNMGGTSIEFGLPHRAHLATLRRRPLIPWNKFFSFDDETLRQTSDQDRLLFYAQAWALIHRLVSTSGQGAISPTALTRSAAEGSPQALNASVLGMLSASELRTRRASIQGTPSIEASTQLSTAELNAYLGDLSCRMKEFAAAEAYFKTALNLEPKLAIANASLGLMRMTQRKFAEAKVLFDKALAADSNNFLVYYYSAFLINREHTDDLGMVAKLPAEAGIKMRSLLRRSVELNPDHAESYKLLAFVSLVNGDDLDGALTAIERAIAIQPGNQEYRLIAAQLLLRLDRAREAVAAATRILTVTKDRYYVSEAEQIVASGKEYLNSKLLVNDLKIAPVFLKRRDLTDDDIANIERNREINNLNRLIDRPGPGERQEVGRIEALGCGRDGVTYRFRSAGRVVQLSGKTFDDLSVKVLLNGTHSFTFRCDGSLADVLAVVIYRPTQGLLRSVAFVPEHFRLKNPDEIAREPLVIIEGMRSSDLSANSKAVEAEQFELERQMRETQMRNIEMRLRQPERGEARLIAIPESLSCVEGRYVVTAKAEGLQRTFSAPILSRFVLRSFSPETGMLEIGCRTSLPSATAVITYKSDPNVVGRDELIAVEFVPKSFKLL